MLGIFRSRGLKTSDRRRSSATPVGRADCPIFSALQDTTCQGAVRRPSLVQSGPPHSTTSKAHHVPFASSASPGARASAARGGLCQSDKQLRPRRLLAAFADDALVNDQLRDYWGKSAIREWAARDIIGERLTMHVVKIMEHYGHFILTANIDGNYDKRGLPDPLALTFYFSAHGDQIVQLIILRNQSDF